MNTLQKTLISAAVAMAVPSVSAQGLEEVIVTAQKRSETLQEFAGAISAFTEKQIDDRGFTTADRTRPNTACSAWTLIWRIPTPLVICSLHTPHHQVT